DRERGAFPARRPELHAALFRAVAPRVGGPGGGLLVAGLAAGRGERHPGAGPAALVEPPPLSRLRAPGPTPDALQPLGRAGQPPLPYWVYRRHIRGLARA